ncbi:hypothetical protein [Yinghuangia sp. YIM S09857]|uniref:hypothetical protein n=1 Tax=Yinghuangia sp. YIM S09857 TaxID=3436929 RepID=UPI003F52D090
MSRSKANSPNAASKRWNKGKVGTPTSAADRPLTATCGTEGCGIPEAVADESDPTLWSWILVRVNGSIMHGRWFCCAACAYHGMALAELRMDGAPC